MAKGPSPLLGYNTNVRHKSRLYHIQTEDSGTRHPHIITHLFADGGRIIATKKTTYAEHLGREDYQVVVRKLMQGQHKAMFIALRDGAYDEEEPAPAERGDETQRVQNEPTVDVDALEAAAARMAAAATAEHLAPEPVAEEPAAAEAPAAAAAKPPATPPPEGSPPGAGRYSTTQPSAAFEVVRGRTKPAESIFGNDLLSEKSLDEVILSYLADDLEEGEG